MQLAINRGQLNQRVAHGLAELTPHPWANGTIPYAPDEPVANDGYDPEEAKKLLAKAKSEGYDGKVDLIWTSGPFQDRLYGSQGDMLKAVGFDVDGRGVPQAQFLQNVFGKQFSLAGWAGGIVDPACPTCGVSSLASDNPGNLSGYQSDAMDQVVADMYKASGDQELAAAIKAFGDIWTTDTPSVTSMAIPFFAVYSDKLGGMNHGPSGPLNVMFDRMYLKD